VIAFAGAKILLAPVLELKHAVTVAIIAAVFAAGVAASIVADRFDPPSTHVGGVVARLAVRRVRCWPRSRTQSERVWRAGGGALTPAAGHGPARCAS